ncbi:MAG: GIY-YIG nuclease family protein [Peptococcaceae bacterium]|nr:GIY-YIG nuclease family protein [Peptococcaceae bacterium]
MTEKGFIYVLINPSMPGMVKIGRTSKDPQERIEELSNVTGVPTPFILIYKEFFNDCIYVEKYLHELLEDKGYRISSNKEFFNVPINEVIKIINHTKNKFDTILHETTETEKLITHNEFCEIDEYAYSIYEKAKDIYFGHGDVLQDCDEALKLFKKASTLGVVESFFYLGLINFYDYENTNTALKYFKEGAKNKDNFCNAEMAKIYSYPKTKHIENLIKCWKSYFQNININNITDKDIVYFCMFIEYKLSFELDLNYDDILSFCKNRLLIYQDKHIERVLNGSYEEWYKRLVCENGEKIRSYIHNNLTEPNKTSAYMKANRVSVEIEDMHNIQGNAMFGGIIHRGVIKLTDQITIISRYGKRNAKIITLRNHKGSIDIAEQGEELIAILVDDSIDNFRFVRDGSYIVAE